MKQELELVIAHLRRLYLHLNAGEAIKAYDLSMVIGNLEAIAGRHDIQS